MLGSIALFPVRRPRRLACSSAVRLKNGNQLAVLSLASSVRSPSAGRMNQAALRLLHTRARRGVVAYLTSAHSRGNTPPRVEQSQGDTAYSHSARPTFIPVARAAFRFRFLLRGAALASSLDFHVVIRSQARQRRLSPAKTRYRLGSDSVVKVRLRIESA